MKYMVNLDLSDTEIQFILWALEKQVEYGGRVEVMREYIGLIEKLGNLLLEKNSVNQ